MVGKGPKRKHLCWTCWGHPALRFSQSVCDRLISRELDLLPARQECNFCNLLVREGQC